MYCASTGALVLLISRFTLSCDARESVGQRVETEVNILADIYLTAHRPENRNDNTRKEKHRSEEYHGKQLHENGNGQL